MINNKLFRYFFYVITFISLLVSLNVAVRRYQFEIKQSDVQVAVSLRDMNRLAIYGGSSLKSVLTRLKDETSITTIALEEDTLEDFVESGKITVLKGSEIMNMHRVGHINRTILNKLYKQVRLDPNHFYLLIDEKRDFEQIRDFFRAEFGKENVNQIKSYNILEIVDSREDLMSIGLGISERKKDMITDMGFKAVYRLRNSNRLNPNIVKQKIASFTEESYVSAVMFEGESILGYPTQLDLVKDKFEDKQIRFGVIEFAPQRGMSALTKDLAHSIFRVHSVESKDGYMLPVDKAVDRYLRAVKERGIDMLFVHPYMNTRTTLPIIDYNINFFNELTSTLINNHFELFTEKQYPQQSYFPITTAEKMVLSFAVLTTLLFFISFFRSLSALYIIGFYAVSLGALYFLEWAGHSIAVSKFMAFMVALMFPAGAIITQFPQNSDNKALPQRLVHSLGYLVRIVGICLIGSMLIVGFLSDMTFLKGIYKFSGVKLSFIIPLILVGLFFYLRPHRISSTFFVLKRLYYAPVRTAGLVSIFLMGVCLLILIIRSGNLIVLPSFYLESEFRSLLESLFYVRPRTKEFLFGYPFLLLSYIYIDRSISRSWVWFFNILGAIALVSVVNSFCHIHTPLHISFYRSILGVLLGIGVTGVTLLAYQLIRKKGRRKGVV